MKKSRFLSGLMVCMGWLAALMATGEFTVFLAGWAEGLIRVCLLVVFCWTQFSYIRINKKIGARA